MRSVDRQDAVQNVPAKFRLPFNAMVLGFLPHMHLRGKAFRYEVTEPGGKSQVLLGNIDPVRVLREGTPEQVRDAIEECHLHAGSRYIAGAGCEVVRDTPHDNLRALIEYAKTHAPSLNGRGLE